MLRNVVAVVSGGSSGLGAATTSQIISHGGRVLVADLESSKDNYLKLAASACTPFRNTDSPIATSCETYYPHRPQSVTPNSGGISSEGELLHTGPVIAFAPTNVTEESEVQQALDDAEERFGEPGMSHVVHIMAGIRNGMSILITTSIHSSINSYFLYA